MWRVLALAVLLPSVLPPLAVSAFDDTSLFEAFRDIFPPSDGSDILASEAVYAGVAREHLAVLGIPDNVTAFCAMGEPEILLVLMKASLGNLLIGEGPGTKAADGTRPYLTNPVDGKLVYVDDYGSNRLLIFQVLTFSLLLALARSWGLAGGSGDVPAGKVVPLPPTRPDAGVTPAASSDIAAHFGLVHRGGYAAGREYAGAYGAGGGHAGGVGYHGWRI